MMNHVTNELSDDLHDETQGHFGSRNEAIAEAARPEAAEEEGLTVGVAQNQALVARFYDQVWDKGNVAFAHEVFADDYVRHDLRPTQALPGPAGQAKIAEDFRRAFPDLRFVVDLMLGDGALVAARWTATGTHTGPWGALDPTGKRASFSGVNIFRFHGGRVVEIWNHRDDLGLMTQLGVPVFAGNSPSA